MKILKSVTLSLLSTLFVFSCSSSTTSNEEESIETAKEESCTYSFVSDSTTLKWTAYKFTKRAGVSGTFDHIAVNNTKTSDTMTGVLVGSDFSIHTPSVNSGNAERDPKLVAHFFNKLIESEAITGKIVSVNNSEAIVSITMNEKTVDIVGKLSEEGTSVTLTASVDMADFEGLDAVAALNEVCSAKHTDEDGESKLWPDVDIVVSTMLKRECK